MPKLTKKHRTFDCDLNFLEPTHQQPANISQRVNQPNASGQHQQQPQLIAQPNDNLNNYSSTSTNTATYCTYVNEKQQQRNDVDRNLMLNNLNLTNESDDHFDETFEPKQRNKSTTAAPLINETNNNNNIENEHPQRLSKLVLSSSLHQLADSKFHTNHHHHLQQQHSIDAQQLPQHHFRRDINTQSMMNEYDNPNATYDVHPSANKTNIKSNDAEPKLRNQSKPSTTTPKIDEMNTHETHNINNNNINNNHDDNKTKITASKQTNTNNVHKPRQQREANLDTVHVVVGNEACDLDSAVSCLLMFHIISKMSDEINGKDKTRTLYIPLLNTTREMLDSKCEVLWFLQKTLNIDKSFLTCKDDIDWVEIKKNNVEVLITLVDHNYNDEFKDIGKIVEIIDHHQVQNPQWLMENQSGIRLTLDNSVGSCTTLVAERLFYIYAEHHVSDEILLLIYGTVLLDTICLSEKAKRFTRRDVYLLKKLDALLGSKRPVRDELYRQLVEVKNSTKDLNFEHLMKRDLKTYKDKRGMRVGIASLFGMAAKEALGLAANIDLDQFFRQNQYEAFIIMGLIADLDHSDSISRDLVLISANGRLFDELRRAFEQDTSKLDLVPIGSDSSPDPEDNIINNKKIVDSSANPAESTRSEANQNPFYKARIWLQRNVTSSRKVVAPLVLKVLHDGV